MKVFVRTESLGTEKPAVIAFYPDDSNIPANAHGDGITVLNVPMQVIEIPAAGIGEFRLPSLTSNWREAAGDMPVKAEVRRRIETEFPTSEQISSLFELIDALIRHGSDISKWPTDVRQRKAEFDKKWKYVTEVQEHGKTHAAVMPRDPSSDKIWPRRLARS
jgi:hypothetical protein